MFGLGLPEILLVIIFFSFVFVVAVAVIITIVLLSKRGSTDTAAGGNIIYCPRCGAKIEDKAPVRVKE